MFLPMARVQMIGAKRSLERSVRLLHRLGTVQIDRWSEARSPFQHPMTLDDDILRLRERLAYLSARVEALLETIPDLELPPSSDPNQSSDRSADRLPGLVEEGLAELEPQAQALVARRDQLEHQLASLPRYEATLQQLLPLLPGFLDLQHYAVTAIWLERRHQAALDAVTRRLEELTEGLCKVISRGVDADLLAAVLIFPRIHLQAVNDLLGRENLAQVRLPREWAARSLEEALAGIRRQLQVIPQEMSEIGRRMEALARAWRPRLLAWRALLRDEMARIDVCPDFGQTDYTFVIEGWIPEDRLAGLQAALEDELSEEVCIVRLTLGEREKAEAPVVLANPALARPFEPLIELLGLPRYDALDPSLLLSIFFPIFFGMILGDIGHGAVLLAVMPFLRRRFKTLDTVRRLAQVIMMGAAWSILFGFLYGEFFGDLGRRMGLRPLWFDRGQDLRGLFLLAAGVGAGHVALGIALGFWQALRRHSRSEAMEKGSMLVSLAALFLLVAIAADYLPEALFTPGVALLVVGVSILIYSLGGLGFLLGPLELLGALGNILSYVRLAAIGLSSVYLAQVANHIAGVPGNLLVGLIIAGLFHALNVTLGAFSPAIHSLRLHYVEFFGKFYKGGGQPYHPFQCTAAPFAIPQTKGD